MSSFKFSIADWLGDGWKMKPGTEDGFEVVESISDARLTIRDTNETELGELVPTVRYSRASGSEDSSSFILVHSEAYRSKEFEKATQDDRDYSEKDGLPPFGIELPLNIPAKKVWRIKDVLRKGWYEQLADPKSMVYQAAREKLRLFDMAAEGEADPKKRQYRPDELDELCTQLEDKYEGLLDAGWKSTVIAAEMIRDEPDEPHLESA